MIKDMASMPDEEKIIYITPLLSETHRIAGTQYDKNDEKKKPTIDADGLYLYDTNHTLYSRRFRHPQSQQGDGKRGGLLYQVRNNENIVASHALFQKLTPEIVREIAERDYHLVMDEVLDVWNVWEPEESPLKPKEIPTLIQNGTLKLDSNGLTLSFNYEKFGQAVDTTYEELAALCDLKQLLHVNNTTVWQMPFSALQAFKSVTIGTYLFEGSLLSAYLKYFGAEIKIEYFGKRPSDIKQLISIVEDSKLNAIGEKRNSLSYTGLTSSKNTELRKQLKANLITFYKSRSKRTISHRQIDRIWTCPKAIKEKIKGEFGTAWLASTTKATNDFSERWYLAYLLEKNMKPPIKTLLSKLGVSIDEDKYAISEIVQWVWRSRIRKEEEIVLYLPSRRMRDLFKGWLDDRYDLRPSPKVGFIFIPVTLPFRKNGKLSREWYEAAIKAGVSNKESWELFRERFIDYAKMKELNLINSEDVVDMPW